MDGTVLQSNIREPPLSQATARDCIKRLLFFLPTNQIGGAERHSFDLCKAFAKSGAKVTVVTTAAATINSELQGMPFDVIVRDIAWSDDRSLDENIARQQAEVAPILDQRFDFGAISLPWPIYGYGLHRALIEKETPHILISHLAPAAVESYQIPAGIRVANEHYDRGLATWVAVSQGIARRIERSFGLTYFSVQHIPNGVLVLSFSDAERAARRLNARQSLGIDKKRKLVMVLGRLDFSKGADLLPAIAEEIADLEPLIICAGSGPLYSQLEESGAMQKGLIRLLGQLPNAKSLLYAADVLFLPSRLEGSPLVFLEAAAAKCPVIATDVALESYGETADRIAMLAPQDDVTQLSGALRTALESPELLTSLVQKAFETAKQFDRQSMTEMYMSLCRKTKARAVLSQATNFRCKSGST